MKKRPAKRKFKLAPEPKTEEQLIKSKIMSDRNKKKVIDLYTLEIYESIHQVPFLLQIRQDRRYRFFKKHPQKWAYVILRPNGILAVNHVWHRIIDGKLIKV